MRVSLRQVGQRPVLAFEKEGGGQAWNAAACARRLFHEGKIAAADIHALVNPLYSDAELQANFLGIDRIWPELQHVHKAIVQSGWAYADDLGIPADAPYLPLIGAPPLLFGLAGNCPMTWRASSTPIPVYPVGYTRTPHTVTAHQNRVTLPVEVTSFRCAVELGVILGRTAHRVPRDKVWDYVAGFTVVNDMISNHWKDFAASHHPECKPTFLELLVTSYYGRGTRGFAPMGPALVSRDEVGNPYDLLMYSRLNGKALDRSHSNAMVVGIEAAVEYLSGFMTLPAGSVLHMGTMGLDGITVAGDKKLTEGDCVELEIEKVGCLRTYFRDERRSAK